MNVHIIQRTLIQNIQELTKYMLNMEANDFIWLRQYLGKLQDIACSEQAEMCSLQACLLASYSSCLHKRMTS